MFLKTHPDSENIGIEVLHGGSPITALGLAELAPEIIRETIMNGSPPPDVENDGKDENKDNGKDDRDDA